MAPPRRRADRRRAPERAPLTPAEFARAVPVSRETLDRLAAYLELLAHWQRRINLVGAASLADPWRRHILDSAQLVPLLDPAAASLRDLGAGAGLPGLVIALLGAGRAPAVTLIESDSRKCAFLREAIRITGAAAEVIEGRIESVPGPPAAIVTARALAPLPVLLGLVARHLAPDGVALLHKGARVDEELTAAGKDWTMTVTRHSSLSEPGGAILDVRNLRRADSGRA